MRSFLRSYPTGWRAVSSSFAPNRESTSNRESTPTGLIRMISMKILAAVSVCAVMICAGCGAPSASSGDPAAATDTPAGGIAPATATFDGTRAFTLLQAQCDFGPRPNGTDAHTKCLNWIVQQLTPNVDAAPSLQSFSYTSRKSGQTFTVTNIIGRINPSAKTQVLLAAHWDTRTYADQDPVLSNRSKPILGANDGASETAVLLELARVFHANRPSVGVEFVFFDAEDFAPVPGDYDEMYLGSKYFAQHLTDPKTGASLKPTYGILLDMIGDKQLDIFEETNSVAQAPAIVQKVWGAAAALGYGGVFVAQPKYTIEDDHLPLLNVGIPTVDCIDFDYDDPQHQYWHTLQDTPDKCSAQSLGIVGSVISKVVYDQVG